MKDDAIVPMKPIRVELPAGKMRCHGCGAIYDHLASPALWFPSMMVHEFRHSLPLTTHQYCCGAQDHTEIVGTVSAYLRDVKGNARMVCNLVNQHLLAGRPQPAWLTEAWERWEAGFVRPPHR